jgi:hypothetical protein
MQPVKGFRSNGLGAFGWSENVKREFAPYHLPFDAAIRKASFCGGLHRWVAHFLGKETAVKPMAVRLTGDVNDSDQHLAQENVVGAAHHHPEVGTGV